MALTCHESSRYGSAARALPAREWWWMLHDLDSSLEALLHEQLPADLREQTTISFASPGSDFPPPSVTLPAISMFLYALSENHDLRSSRPDWERRGDATAYRKPNPVRVDCHYLVTAWARDGVPNPEQDEHRLLGAAMVALLRHRELPPSVLRGALVASDKPVRTSVLHGEHVRSIADFWKVLGGKPRPSFNLIVTVALDVMPVEEGGDLTKQAVVKISSK